MTRLRKVAFSFEVATNAEEELGEGIRFELSIKDRMVIDIIEDLYNKVPKDIQIIMG